MAKGNAQLEHENTELRHTIDELLDALVPFVKYNQCLVAHPGANGNLPQPAWREDMPVARASFPARVAPFHTRQVRELKAKDFATAEAAFTEAGGQL